MKIVIAYMSVATAFLIIDAVWLGVLAKDFYRNQLGDLMLEQPKLLIAAGFYLLYTAGIVLFAVRPALEENNIFLALGYGAVFGLIAYGTYDMTNLATIKKWPVMMSMVDMAWGTFITAIAAGIGYFITVKSGL